MGNAANPRADSGTVSTEELARTVELLKSSLAASSLASYNAVWKKFQDFVYYVLHMPFVLPVPVDWVLYFVAYLYITNSAHATIATALSVVGYAHKIRNMPDPTMLFIVRRLLQATRKLAQKPDLRRPVTHELLEKMLPAIASLGLSCHDQLLAHAILTVMYTAGFRVGEVASATNGTDHTVLCNEVHFVWDGHAILQYVILLRSYKHSGGQHKTIRITKKQPSIICPVLALTNYLQWRGQYDGFLFQHEIGQVVTDTWVTQLIRDLLKALKMDPTHYSSHSMRIGATTDLVSGGASDGQIRIFGHWKSNAGAKYVRPDEIVV